MEYERSPVPNAFGAPVWHVLRTASTMDDAREFARSGAEDGTALYADFQSAGRGRVEGRVWESKSGDSLLCTVILRRPPVTGFTLRVGLAVARTFDHFLASASRAAIKWPNDVLIDGKKLAGVLCENADGTISVGTGFNLGQRAFPDHLRHRATSLSLILEGPGQGLETRGHALPSRSLPTPEAVLERYLENLKIALADPDWAAAVAERLWKKGSLISFLAGDPGKGELIEGWIAGIGDSGELLFRENGKDGVMRIFSGEFPYEEADS